MRPRRLLIVDASTVIRRALAAALSDEPGIDVVGSASSGRIALMKLPLLLPDVVALDAGLPGPESLDTLAAIRATFPRLPVIMLSAATPRSAAATVDALSRGANDYIMKSDAAVPSDQSLTTLGADLVSKIEACCLTAVAARPAAVPRRPWPPPAVARVDVVAIGVSTGGPGALMDLIPMFAADFPVPILIVQHMPPMFTKLLAERLNSRCAISVMEATSGMLLEPGKAWVAPGDFHLGLERTDGKLYTRVFVGPPENSCRPAVDVMLRSVAQHFGVGCLSVILTGMGQDGLRGCEAVSSAGGQIVAQDEASSVVWGMPGFVAQAGLASRVLPLDEIASEILRRVMLGRVRNTLGSRFLGAAA